MKGERSGERKEAALPVNEPTTARCGLDFDEALVMRCGTAWEEPED